MAEPWNDTNAYIAFLTRKPDDQYEFCERIAPRALRIVELFARQTWPSAGWSAWGLETTKFEPEAL